MSLDLSITGHHTSFPASKHKRSYRFKAANSFVDETLFGSFGGKVDPVLQWTAGTPSQISHLWRSEEENESNNHSVSRNSCTPSGTSRRKTQFRVKSRSPSYCDESLFGPKVEDCGWEAPWVKKEDSVKIRPLLWSPPPIIRPHSLKPNAKPHPLKAVHPVDAESSPLGTQTVKGNFWKPPECDSDSGGCPSVAHALARGRQSSPGRNTSRSSSCSGRPSTRRGSSTGRPPWK